MVKKSKQKDLFGLDPKEEEKLLSHESLKEKIYRKAEEKSKLKEAKAKKKEQEKEFHESVKQTEKYLSWGRGSNVWGKEWWTSLKIKTFNKGGVYKLIWTLPLYEELFSSVTKQDLIFKENPRLFDFDNGCYKEVIESCEEFFLNREVINAIPTNLEYLENQERFSEHLGKMQYTRNKNVITFKWEYPSHIERKSFLGRKKEVDFKISREEPDTQLFYEQIHYAMC